MGEATNILWAGRPLPDGTIEKGYSWNPWIGCQKVSAGCLHCYAARDNARYQWVREWGKDYRLTSDSNWKKPIQWAKQAVKDGVIRRVFCASLADVFDANVQELWRARLWQLVEETYHIGGLEWLLLTKRPENINTRIPMNIYHLSNVRIGITCENQEMFDLRVPILLNSWTGKNFISVEPMLSAISFEKTAYSVKQVGTRKIAGFTLSGLMRQINWVICGCESGTGARPCNIEWIRDLRDQCQAANVPFFLKQMEVDGKLVKEPYLDGVNWLEFPKDR
jgi:protein gp37